MDRLTQWAPWMLGILRIMTGLLFFEHGSSKIVGFPPVGPGGGPVVQPPLMSMGGASGLLEFLGGFLIVIGLCSRPVAFLLSGEMAVGYFLVHAPHGFFPMANGGDAAILFCFVFLYLAFAGGGDWSADAWLARRKAPPGAA